MNILHVKYAVEVARAGSLNKASENLLIAVPNISRSIKELEADLGISIFERTSKGMFLTSEGEEFVNYAKEILNRIDKMEKYYKEGTAKKQRFSISVPRASYISSAFSEFSTGLKNSPTEMFYKETNALKAINNILKHNYKLGIIRYAENYDKYFKSMLDEKGLEYELVTEFSYSVMMNAEHPLADKNELTTDDLQNFIEIAHADPYVPSMPSSKVMNEELSDKVERRIYVFERASQFDLLSRNRETFMWVSPTPQSILDRFSLVLKKCDWNKKVYKDVLIYKKGYKFTEIDKKFITALCDAKREIFEN